MSEFVEVAKVGDLPPGQVRVVMAKGKRLALANLGGQLFALDDICTHDGGPLGEGEILDESVECPRHGARFDVRTGRVVALPAVRPVAVYHVRVEGEKVLVDIASRSLAQQSAADVLAHRRRPGQAGAG
ncbi:MAG TPA: non-heme iron oxygenase ferredoxin subunit [Dehalococcoidia bacterium]|nr:non-heme iron oxygenase ferredoxin subunit [Dehalococcoidia bacterium]